MKLAAKINLTKYLINCNKLNNKKENLFQLIKSLSKNEKGYFKKYASFHTMGDANNYVLLFDAISRRETYDEKVIKQELHPTIRPENFREAKTYLYEMLLKALDLYHSNSSRASRLRRLVHSVEILFNKALYEQCRIIIGKAERMALDVEKFDVLTELCDWKLKIINVESFKGIKEKDLDDLRAKEWEYYEKIKKTAQYKYFSASLFYKLRGNRHIRSKDEITRLYSHILNDELLKNETESDTLQVRFYRYSMLGAYYFISGEPEASLEFYRRYFNIFENQPGLIHEYAHSYMVGLSNLVGAYLQLGKYTEAMAMVNKLEEIKPRTLRQEINLFLFINARKLGIFLNTLQLKKAMELIPFIDKGIARNSDKINITIIISFQFNIACVYFLSGDYKKALLRINQIIHLPAQNLAVDAQSFARILNLIIHYELGNTELLPHTIRSTYRFLIKKERLFEFENLLIRFMNRLQKNIREAELKLLFKEFKNECILLSKDPFEKKVFVYFDFISWLESKIENKSFTGILKEKISRG